MGKGNLTAAKASTLTAGLGGCCWRGIHLSRGGLGDKALPKKLSTPCRILASSLPMCSEQRGKGKRKYLLFSGGTTGLEADPWPKRPPPG